MPGAAIYCRISRDRTGAGLGVERQEQDCRALAQRLDMPVETVLVDNDLSAYSGKKRPSYTALIEGIKARQYSAVIAWHPDRLHRSPLELEGFIDVLDATGCQVHTVQSGRVDLSSATGRLNARVIGAFARYESEHRSDRIKRKHLELAEKGLPSGGLRAFGYESDGITIREDEAEIVREMCSRFLAGDSIHSLVIDVTRRGVSTVRGGEWTNQQIRQIIGRARNAGLRIRHGEVFAEGVWPALVSKDVWMACRTRLDDPSRRVSFSNARVYLLTGLALCGKCGAKMRGTPRATGQLVYRCKNACVARDMRSVDSLVIGAVVALLSSPATQERLLRPRHGRNYAAEILNLQDRRKDAAKLYARGVIDITALEQITTEINGQVEQLSSQTANDPKAAVVELVGNAEYVRRRWVDLSLDRRRVVIDALMSVTIFPSPKGRKFHPESVRLSPR